MSGYVGRFAPSPSGPLHFGSMVAALGSFLEARSRGGRWLLRMEDVDTPRVVPGAAESILATLVAHGLEWDGEVVWQSRRQAAYQAALAVLRQRGLAFACACTRRELADSALAPDGSRRYPGTCRNGLPPGRDARAWRVRVGPGALCVTDLIQGPVCEDLERDVGDFIVLRADGLFAYQLAVVVDDAEAGVTHVVRGADLLGSTCRQVHLQRCLDVVTPVYAHLPVATNRQGEKLSKQTLARAVDGFPPALVLIRVLEFLGQQPPPSLAAARPRDVLEWALTHWELGRVPQQLAAPATLPEAM